VIHERHTESICEPEGQPVRDFLKGLSQAIPLRKNLTLQRSRAGLFVARFWILREIQMRFAVEHIRRMRGGSQAHLMRCDDDSFYVVKFKNNPQGVRVLANDMFGTRLAARMGICVPDVDIVEVADVMIKNTDDLCIQLGTGRVPCAPGRQFGSKYPGHPSRINVYDFVSAEEIYRIANLGDFLGTFVFDKWTCNTDGRQAVMFSQKDSGTRGSPRRALKAMMIDQGFCFNGREWNFPDAPGFGRYGHREVYRSVRGIESFEPWLNWLENRLSLATLYEEADKVPIEWYVGEQEAWRNLIERLYARRTRVRELIWSASNAIRNPFPNWTGQFVQSQ
jgi:hypothetical protein